MPLKISTYSNMNAVEQPEHADLILYNATDANMNAVEPILAHFPVSSFQSIHI